MSSSPAGIPMQGMIPADKLAAPATHSHTALRSYIPALDGVRGLAILVVMCCHFVWANSEHQTFGPPDTISRYAVEMLKTGRYGVDLFFVLSGFLITGILYDAKHDKHYFRNFYARRTLRIFPLYYSVLLIMFLVAPLFLGARTEGEQRIIENQGWMWLYLGNIKASFTQLGPEFFQQDRLWMGHFWSLAIEEQFYLVWPMVILLLSRRAAMGLCIAMVLGAPLVRIGLFAALDHPVGLWSMLYFTVSKVDTLALGALLALTARSPGGLVKFAKLAPWTFALAALALAPMLVVKWPKHTFMGGLAENTKLSIICLFCGSLLVMAVSSSPKQIVGWFFTLPIMRFFGKYSYGLYIFHELFNPLFNGPLGVHTIGAKFGVNWYIAMFLHFIVSALIAIGVSLLSWNLLEKHMLKLKRYFEHAPEPRAKPHPVPTHASGPAPAAPAATPAHEPVPMGASSGRMAG